MCCLWVYVGGGNGWQVVVVGFWGGVYFDFLFGILLIAICVWK